MSVLELALIGIGLSMDAFAVAICKGLGMKTINLRYAFILALFFGGFQAGMPLIGWLLGIRFRPYIAAVDHWIAFGLLLFLGVKMAIDAWRTEEAGDCPSDGTVMDLRELLMLAVATSIDALAVGITLAFLQVKILQSAALIGGITFGISLAGVGIGNVFGSRFQKKAALLGGVILIGIGVKILAEHLGAAA